MEGMSGVVASQPGKASEEGLTINIVLAGDSGVGKSALAARFVDGDFREKAATTVGVEVKSRRVNLSEFPELSLNLALHDTPGLAKFKASAAGAYKTAHGVALVYDVTRPESFANLQRHLAELKFFIPPDAEVLVVGTKCDLAGSGTPRVSFEAADEWAAKAGLSLFEVSAASGHNVEDAFKEVASRMVEKLTLGRYDGTPDSEEADAAIFGSPSLKAPPSGFCRWLCV